MPTVKVDTNEIESFINQITEKAYGWAYEGQFTSLTASHHFAQYMNKNYPEQHPIKVAPIGKHLDKIITCLWSMLITFERLELQKQFLNMGCLDNGRYSNFCAQDIKVFYVDFRSIFDHIAEVINLVSLKPGQLPSSFETLINSKDKYKDKLQDPLFQLLNNFPWFAEAREIRTNIVHDGMEITVFPINNPISFQIYNDQKMMINFSQFSINENMVIDFELYAAYYTAHLFLFIEDWAKIIFELLNIPIDKSSTHYHPGLKVFKNWLNRLISLIKDSNVP